VSTSKVWSDRGPDGSAAVGLERKSATCAHNLGPVT
jgi:hypothetical protein